MEIDSRIEQYSVYKRHTRIQYIKRKYRYYMYKQYCVCSNFRLRPDKTSEQRKNFIHKMIFIYYRTSKYGSFFMQITRIGTPVFVVQKLSGRENSYILSVEKIIFFLTKRMKKGAFYG